jgi:predicted PurR-regulated permease PerM
MNDATSSDEKIFVNRALEATIRIGVVVLLVAWCFQIVRPFIVPIVWGIIIAVAVYPGYRRLLPATGGRGGLSAVVCTFVLLVLFIVPALLLLGTLIDSAKLLAKDLSDGTISIPLPPENINAWPIIGKPLARFWHLASTNLRNALTEIAPQLKPIGSWLLSAAAGAVFGILQFVFAIIIAGVLLFRSKGGYDVAESVAARLAGERGPDFVSLATATVRSVTRGILGVALIQSLLAGLGFLVVGIPAAGLLAMICLFLAVIQVGPGLVIIPTIIYVFLTSDTLPAVLFMIWSIFVGLIDNILKPLLLGRGVDVPMVVIFIGAIGGFLSSGIIGLFVGPILLALGYRLFSAWLDMGQQPVQEQNQSNK